MRKKQKQLLGLAGLAVVGIMTATACMVPTPNAAAEGDDIYNQEPEDNGDFQVQVTVTDGKATADVLEPGDNAEYNSTSIPVRIRYERLSRLVTSIEYIDNQGKLQEDVVDDYRPEGAAQDAGTRQFSLDISRYNAKDGSFKLKTQGYDFRNKPLDVDVVAFKYAATVVTPEPAPEEGGNPSIKIEANEDVDKVIIQIWDKNGNPLLVDENGNQKPIIVDKDKFENGEYILELPLEELGVNEGDYTITIDSYDKNNNLISEKTTHVEYKPVTPEIPNTGSNFLKDLNISNLDYILTGLIAFGLIAGFAIYLVVRRNRHGA